MRAVGRFALCGLTVVLAFASSAADDPPPLLKVVTPTKNQVRVRIPMDGGVHDVSQIRAQVPSKKKKQQQQQPKQPELIDVTVAISSQPGQCHITAKKLRSWGYDAVARKEFVLPELLIPASQIAPDAKQNGRDVLVRLTNIKLQVVEVPAAAKDSIYTCDFSLTTTELFKAAERTMEPRLAFKDKFLEFTVNANAVKRLGTSDMAGMEVTADPSSMLVPAIGPMIVRNGRPVFAYASVNGIESYKLANGTVVPVDVRIVSVVNWDPGIVLSIGLARGCKVEMNQEGNGEVGIGVDANTVMIPGKVAELRLGFYTGANYKVQKDFVLKDIKVVVDKNASEGFVWLGRKFIAKHFKDGVYAAGSDGAWKMHARLDPETLFDIKTRKKVDPKQPDPKKKPEPKKK